MTEGFLAETHSKFFPEGLSTSKGLRRESEGKKKEVILSGNYLK